MIDSGSNICIINKSTYNKLLNTPLTTINKKTREVMTDGGPARLIKIVNNFMVIVNDSVIKLNSLYVGLDLQYDVILGSNVLRVSNFCLNLSFGQLCKAPNTIPQCHFTVLNNNSELTTPIINMLFDKYNLAFSTDDFDLGNCQIFAKKQTYLPIDKINKKNPYYECPLHMQSEALALAEKLVQSNVLSRGMGDVIHPVILIRKPNGKQRFIADLRRVNSITEKMVSQISTANNLLSSLQCFKYISKFDLTQGFFQIKINSDEKRYYGIKIGEHYFYYNTLIQGSKNSSILFVSVMQDIYSTINNFTHSKIYIYVDDIIVVTHTNRQDHIEALECLLQTTIKYGLKLSPDKSQLLATETIFLGNHITQNTRKIEQSHITKLLQKNKPETPSQLLSFLQSIQFYREYFRKIHVDITELYKYTSTDRNLKHKKLNMPTSAWKHYDNIIIELKENTGLHLYIPGYPIEVHCDASSYGIGGMLCQRMDEVYTALSFDYLGEIEADTKGTQELLKKLHKMFTKFGRPEKLHRDNARGNLGKELLEYCNSWRIQTSTSTTKYSRSNCLVERNLRDMQSILSKKLIDYKMSRTKVYWSDLLPEVTYQLNTTPILKCEVTPFQIMFSRKGRNYLDLFLQRYSPYEFSKTDPIFQSSKLALDIVQEHQQAERFRHRERVNVNKNDSSKIKVGQSVYLKDSNPRKAKLSSHYKGPYKVHEISSNHVIITDMNGKKIKCHIKSLKILPSDN
uniref:Reverse transcriptase domain-containing protein n=1 Tax=Strongyloides papillosus TaxID=174720 RepID=A0A0N5C4H9_STREA